MGRIADWFHSRDNINSRLFKLYAGLNPIYLIMIGFFIISLRLANRDFYYDEVFTLDNYVFGYLIDIPVKYTYLNNHILFSLITNIYMEIINVHKIKTVLDNPYIIRLPLLVLPMVLLWTMNKLGGWVSALLLATTIPFYYYSCAVRGYMLSMMLFIMFLYFTEKKKWWKALTSGVLFIYVMPSNAVFILAVSPFLGFRHGQNAMYAIIGALSIGYLLYLPVLSDMFNDPQTSAHNSAWINFTKSLPETVNAFISYRWGLLIIPVINYTRFVKYNKYLELALSATILSFIMFIASGNYLWARVMFPLLPLWCLAGKEIMKCGN